MRKLMLGILAGVFSLLLAMVCFSLSVPPADMVVFAAMIMIGFIGALMSLGESKKWRVFWAIALAISLLGGVLEFVSGKHLSDQRSKHEVSTTNSSQ